MSTQTQRDSATEAAITRALIGFARAEAKAIRAINSGLPINALRKRESDTTDHLLTPLEIEALRWVAKFGWVRWWTLARLMWSASPAPSARTLGMRMIRNLAKQALIYPVTGGDGKKVFLLAERGAAYLRTYFPGLYARDLSVGRRGLTAGTRQTSPAGATFIHRLITNAYLADSVANGRLIATEYEQLVDTEEWRIIWRQVAYRAKRCDGLSFMADPMSGKDGAVQRDIEIIEMLRKRPDVSLTRNDQGVLVQDEMGRLLISLREHSANRQRVTLVLLDERSGHGIARTLIRYAAQRGIKVSPEFVQFVFVPMRPGSPIFGPFRRTPWPGGRPVAVAPSTPAANTAGVAAASSGVADSPANKPAPPHSAGNAASLERPSQTARQPEFRRVRDKRLANGDREIIIQHLPTGITAQTTTGVQNTSAHLEFTFFDPEGEPLYVEPVICQDTVDLTNPAEFEELCDELRQIIPDADRDD